MRFATTGGVFFCRYRRKGYAAVRDFTVQQRIGYVMIKSILAVFGCGEKGFVNGYAPNMAGGKNDSISAGYLFFENAELRSINKAAAKLYVSQPSLSQSIKNLEDELNIRLFRRSNKGVVLTEDGKRFLQYAERIADQMELIEGLAREKRENRLSVALYPMVSTAKLIADFMRRRKKIL